MWAAGKRHFTWGTLFNVLVPVCECKCVSGVCVCVDVHICMHGHVGTRGKSRVSSQKSHLPPLRQGLSLVWSIPIWLARKSWGSICLLPGTEITRLCHYIWCFFMGSGDHTQVPHLQRQVLYQLSYLANPIIILIIRE